MSGKSRSAEHGSSTPKRLPLGYTGSLDMFPFDHRGSYGEKSFGVPKNHQPNLLQSLRIRHSKQLLYAGFERAVNAYDVPREEAAFLVDEQFGRRILDDARRKGYTRAMSVEKSQQQFFSFEYGKRFGQHLEDRQPTLAKALIRYNPEDPNRVAQLADLKKLSDYAHSHGFKFLLEPLIEPTPDQKRDYEWEKSKTLFDEKVRPELAVRMIRELQEAGIEPDVWKIEGFKDPKHYEQVVAQARSGQTADGESRKDVGIIVLGRGGSTNEVIDWLKAGAQVEGVIGFAIGRTIFQKAIDEYLNITGQAPNSHRRKLRGLELAKNVVTLNGVRRKDRHIAEGVVIERVASSYASFHRIFDTARREYRQAQALQAESIPDAAAPTS